VLHILILIETFGEDGRVSHYDSDYRSEPTERKLHYVQSYRYNFCSIFSFIHYSHFAALQAEEFLAESVKHLNVFKDSADYGWKLIKRDVRKMIMIQTKDGNYSSIKSYPSALKGDAKIDNIQ
jgi:hypothetical protein